MRHYDGDSFWRGEFVLRHYDGDSFEEGGCHVCVQKPASEMGFCFYSSLL